MNCERKGTAAVAWLKGTKHRFYEDRYRILTRDIPLVASKGRGEIYAVFDGIGSAPMGMNAAQEMCDQLLRFYRETDVYVSSTQGLETLLMKANSAINGWGMMPGTDRPLGGCAGTHAWIRYGRLTLFHAGDTAAILVRDGEPRPLVRLHEVNGGIFRYFGLGPNLEIDIESIALTEGDLVLLVSDGVTKAFHQAEAARIVAETFSRTGDVAVAAKELATRSRSTGSSDDITAMVIEVEG